MSQPSAVLLVGCGKMGQALLRGWLASPHPPDRIAVVEPDPEAVAVARGLPGAAGRVTIFADLDAFVASGTPAPDGLEPDVVVIAVKPQGFSTLLPGLARFASPTALFLSIAAGRTIGGMSILLGRHARIVRAMPNTPAAIGRGISVLCAGPGVSEAQRTLAQTLMQAAGAVEWIASEAQMDAVTALSGSGPAYVFLLVEAMAAAGARAGLPVPLAERLARATVSGAGALLTVMPEDPTELRRNVTSPGGTTAAALDVLMAPDGIQPLFDEAIAAATRRSRALAG